MNIATFIAKIEAIYGRYQSNDLKLLVMDKAATVKAPLQDVLVAVVETFSTRWGVQPGLVEIEEALKRECEDHERSVKRLPTEMETELAEQDRMRGARVKPTNPDERQREVVTFSKVDDVLQIVRAPARAPA